MRSHQTLIDAPGKRRVATAAGPAIPNCSRGRLFLEANPPYIACKAGHTKNGRDTRQYIQPELAADMRAHIATKAPKDPVFSLPHELNLARMLRDDLAEARKGWLKEAVSDPDEYARREQDDFLTATNHHGETLDFHSLRHTCGAWLAMSGVHPKVVQTVIRHQSITLMMNTYDHLFPGQEADAVARMRDMMITPPEALRANGTDDFAVEPRKGAQRSAHDAIGGETTRWAAMAGRQIQRKRNRPSS